MAEIVLSRVMRTPSSEAYIISEDDHVVGRIDLHFLGEQTHVTVVVNESLTQESIEDIVTQISADIIGPPASRNQRFFIYVFQGREAGFYTDEDFEDDSEF